MLALTVPKYIFRNGLLQKRKPVQGASSVNTLPAKSCQPWLIIIKLLGWRLCLAALVYGEFRCEYQPESIGIFNEFKGDSVGKYGMCIPGLINGLNIIRL